MTRITSVTVLEIPDNTLNADGIVEAFHAIRYGGTDFAFGSERGCHSVEKVIIITGETCIRRVADGTTLHGL